MTAGWPKLEGSQIVPSIFGGLLFAALQIQGTSSGEGCRAVALELQAD